MEEKELAEETAEIEITEPETEKEPPKQDKMAPAREFIEWVELFGYAVAFVVLMFTFLARIAIVNGPSMEQTLHDGEVLIVSDLFYTPEQGDIIVFQSNTILDNEAIVKRVIATEGQTVDIDFETWTVTVDGVALDESYVNYIQNAYMNGSSFTYPLTVEEGKIFVMGDNRNQSTDSRSYLIGQVDTRYVLGHVLFRLLPVDKFGTVQ